MKIEKIVVVVVAAVGIFGLAIVGLLEFQNRTYANKVFANTVAYDKVLASRKWHNQTFGCTYAIVSLKVGSSHSPPDTWLRNETWLKTPVRTNTHISICVQDGEFSSEVAARLQAAVRGPGSYYFHFHETLWLYSKSQNIAALIRYGD